MKEWLNNSEMVISHSNMSARWQFTFWSIMSKIFFCVLIYSYTVNYNWQMHYFRTILNEYHTRPTIKKLELNCRFTGYEDDTMDLAQFYFAGTRGFRLNLDGSYEYEDELMNADGFGTDVPQLGPLLVDGWTTD